MRYLGLSSQLPLRVNREDGDRHEHEAQHGMACVRANQAVIHAVSMAMVVDE